LNLLMKTLKSDNNLPLNSILSDPQKETELIEDLEKGKQTVQATLDNFGIDARVTGANQGVQIVRYEIAPGKSTKPEDIAVLKYNFAMDL